MVRGPFLESLMKAGHKSGVTYKRYTPPVLTIESMLKIISHVIYEKSPDTTTSAPYSPSARPDFSKGLIRFLHDLRGPTRIFQAALLMIQNYSRQVDGQAFDKRMGTLVDRDAIRAGLERIKDAEWGLILERLATLMQTDKICTNLDLLRRDRKLLRRLFHMSFIGETIGVSETFEIDGKTAPLSQLFEYGWVTIVDSIAEGKCTVFLPFLTLYNSAPDDPHAVYHPHLTPLCKGMEWRLIERDDARMLQY
ncbi:hypothetical protein C0993_000905 [Termitomyces sp. T159_Od127]|nr:hypothetical protein C0993_000905 [Termitomyces sp. T159_Od127]